MGKISLLSDQVMQCVQRAHAIRIEDLAWTCPDHTWSQILAVIKQMSQSKQISLVCRRHGGLVVMPSPLSHQVLERPLSAMPAGMESSTTPTASVQQASPVPLA